MASDDDVSQMIDIIDAGNTLGIIRGAVIEELRRPETSRNPQLVANLLMAEAVAAKRLAECLHAAETGLS